MADEKSIYERWSEERLDPPLPKEWGLDEEDEAELLWPIWPLLFMGESDTEQYVETITDYVMDVLGLEYDGENEDSKLWEKRVEDYVDELIKRRRAFAAELGITPRCRRTPTLTAPSQRWKKKESSHDRTSPAAVPAPPQKSGMRSTIAVNGRDTSTSTSRTPKASRRAAAPMLALVPSLPTQGRRKMEYPEGCAERRD